MVSREMCVLQNMFWEQAKANLRSYLGTFYPEYDSGGKKIDTGFDEKYKLINEFINEFEGY